MFTFPIAFFSSSGSTPPAEAFENYYSTDFDGTDDYITMGNVSSLDFSNSDAFSISAWVKLDTVSSTHKMIVSKMDETTDYRGYNIRSYNGAVKVSLSNDAGTNELQYTSTANPLTAGTWHHVVFTYDGSSASSGCTVYVDGSAEAGSWTGTLSATISNSAPFNIGARNNGSLPFNGKIDEVAIFDSTLSASDVTAIYNSGVPDDLSSTSNLKEWYRMGDGANYPIVKNQAHFSQEAINFDGSNDTVGINKISGLTGDATISFWTKWQAQTAQYRGIFSSDNYYCTGATNNFSIQWFNGNTGTPKLRLVMCNGTTCDVFLEAPTLTVGNWYHLAFVLDDSANTVQVYVNGSTLGSALSTTNTFQGLEEGGRISGYKASCNATVNNPLLGQVDDLSIYNSALSGSDITDIYNSGYPKDESERSGLVAYYKFDGDVYPVVRDAMQFSNASLDFDGIDDYVDLGTGLNSYLELGDSFSYSAWVKFSADTTHRTIISSLQASGPKGTQLRVLNTEAIRIIFIQSGAVYKYVDSSVLAVDTWHHVVATYDGSNTVGGINLYINGSLDNSTTGTSGTLTSITSAESLKIGKYASSSNMYEGNIDDVIVFNAELSASDVTDIYNSGKPKDESSTSNVLGYWRMGDNTISPNVPSALGYGTHSVEFDGVSEFISVPHSTSLNITGAISISSWLKWDGGTQEMLVSKEGFPVSGDFKRGWALWAEGYGSDAGVTFTIWSSATAYTVDVGSNLTSGEWSHVVAVFEPSTSLKVYVNGSLAGTNTTSIPATMDSTTAAITIGRFTPAFGTGYLFGGNIKDMAIFDTNLSASDVTALYNSGLPKDLSSESDLVSYWRMGDGEDKYPNILDYKGTNHGTMTNMASDNITTDNIGSGYIWNSPNIVADSPAGTSGQMTNMASDNFVAAKGAGTMTNMDAEGIVADVPS